MQNLSYAIRFPPNIFVSGIPFTINELLLQTYAGVYLIRPVFFRILLFLTRFFNLFVTSSHHENTPI